MLKKFWEKVKQFCSDSESIAWARFKMFVGIVLFTIQKSGVDLSIFMSQKWIAVVKIAAVLIAGDGIVSEYMRRRRTGPGLANLEPKDPTL